MDGLSRIYTVRERNTKLEDISKLFITGVSKLQPVGQHCEPQRPG